MTVPNRLDLDWSGEDSVGIKEAYYAIGTTQEDPTNVRDWTQINPIVTHVVAEGLDLDYGTRYYVSVKLVDNVNHVTIRTSSDGFQTGAVRNALHAGNTFSAIMNENFYGTIRFTNYCTAQSWTPESTWLLVKAVNLEQEFVVYLDEEIEPGGEKTFELFLPGEWTDMPRLLKLEFQMVDSSAGPFGQKVSIDTLARPYIKIASWRTFAGTDAVSVFYKSARSDTDIGVVAKRCESGINGTCDTGTLDILTRNKGTLHVFEGFVNTKDNGELYLFFAPVSRTTLSDKDIVASSVSANPQINERNIDDEAYADHSERLSNRLIAAYYETGSGKQSYLMLANNSSAAISFTLTFRTAGNTCSLEQNTISGYSSRQLYLNDTVPQSCRTKGSVTLEYTGESGALAGAVHVRGLMNYDVDLKDPDTYGEATTLVTLVVPYFKVTHSGTSLTEDTKLWLQNTTTQSTLVTVKIYTMNGGNPIKEVTINLSSLQWMELKVSDLLNSSVTMRPDTPQDDSTIQGGIEIESAPHTIVAHSVIEHYTDGYAEDTGVKDPAFQFTKQLHSPFWIQLIIPQRNINLQTKLYIHNKSGASQIVNVVKQYEDTSSYEASSGPTILAHGTIVVIPTNTTSNPRLKEAGLEIGSNADAGDIIVSESVINTIEKKGFQVPVNSNYCGIPSMLEGTIVVQCNYPHTWCAVVAIRLTHHEYVGSIDGYKLYFGEVAGQWTKITEYETLPTTFDLPIPCTTTARAYYAIQPIAHCGYMPISNVVELGVMGCLETPGVDPTRVITEDEYPKRVGSDENFSPIVDLDSAIIGSFRHGAGAISWGSACTNSTVSGIKVMRQKDGSEPELIHESSADEGSIETEMTDGIYQYWLESFCADGTYRVTPVIAPDPGRDLGPVIIDQADYDLLLQSLGVDTEGISSLKSKGSTQRQNGPGRTSPGSQPQTQIQSESINSHARQNDSMQISRASRVKGRASIEIAALHSWTSAYDDSATLESDEPNPSQPEHIDNIVEPGQEDNYFAYSGYNDADSIQSAEDTGLESLFANKHNLFWHSRNFQRKPGLKNSSMASGSFSSSTATSPSNNFSSSTFTVPPGQFVRYYVWDHLGSTRLTIRKYDAIIIEETKYLPFGKPMQQQSLTTDENHKWAGYMRDLESQLDYLGFRHYNNSLYRFMQPDKIPGDPENPLSWNLYLYLSNNPIRNTDILGLADPLVVFFCPANSCCEGTIPWDQTVNSSSNQQIQDEINQAIQRCDNVFDKALEDLPWWPSVYDYIRPGHEQGSHYDSCGQAQGKMAEIMGDKWAEDSLVRIGGCAGPHCVLEIRDIEVEMFLRTALWLPIPLKIFTSVIVETTKAGGPPKGPLSRLLSKDVMAIHTVIEMKCYGNPVKQYDAFTQYKMKPLL